MEKNKKDALLKAKEKGLITEQEYNEKIAIVEKEENKITKQTTTKNNKKEKDASQNSEQATEEKVLGFWDQIRQIKENKGCFWGMNAIECFLYSTIAFFASLIVMLIIPKNIEALMYGSIMVIVSLVQGIILYSYNRKELTEYYKKTSISEVFSTVFPKIKGHISYVAFIMIGFVIFCFVFYNHSIIGGNANTNDDNEITSDLWCGLYTKGLSTLNMGALYVFKNDLKENGSSICPPPNQCDMGFTLEGYVGVDVKFPNEEYAKEWKKYEKTCIIINGRMRFNEFRNSYEIHNPRFLNYAY